MPYEYLIWWIQQQRIKYKLHMYESQTELYSYPLISVVWFVVEFKLEARQFHSALQLVRIHQQKHQQSTRNWPVFRLSSIRLDWCCYKIVSSVLIVFGWTSRFSSLLKTQYTPSIILVVCKINIKLVQPSYKILSVCKIYIHKKE